MAGGKLRLFQTATVQDETWVLMEAEWKRKLVDNIRPGAWLIDLKRVYPTKHDLDAPPFDPHGLIPIAGHSNQRQRGQATSAAARSTSLG
jgi:hypothetical protein